MTQTQESCPACGKPLKSGTSGSLTQWIFFCSCNDDVESATALASPAETGTTHTIQVCLNCGNRIGAGRSGTLTQWIFRNDICSCENPQPVEKSYESPEEEEGGSPGTLSSTVAELEVDTENFPVERFAPVSILASTNESTVYHSIDRLLGTDVAVKVVKLKEFESLLQFQKEVKILAELNHRGIVEVLDFAEKDGTPYMVMEFVEGSTLREFLETNTRLPVEDTLEVARRLCETLSYCHDKGVLHRDIKPENILVCAGKTDSFEIKLLDFGLAFRLESGTGERMTLAGTPAYMAPDLGKGRPYDQRSEVYSLGCVLFELLSGHPPYEDDDPLQLLKAHAEDEVPPLKVYAPQHDFDAELEGIVRKCLAKEPEDRFQTLAELMSAIHSFTEFLNDGTSLDSVQTAVERSNSSESNAGRGETIFFTLTMVAIIGMVAFGGWLFFYGAPEEVEMVERSSTIGNEDEEREVRRVLEAEKENKYVSFRGRTIYRKPLEIVAGHGHRGKLELFGAKFQDPEDMLVLKDTLYSQISASMSNLNDRHLAALLKMKHLTCFKASFTNLTSAGIKMLSEYKNLDYLQLHELVHDDDLKVLSTMPKLHTLQIQNCDITDRGLSYLSRCKTLLKLDIRACKKVTVDGVKEFKKKVPACKVLPPWERVEPEI